MVADDENAGPRATTDPQTSGELSRSRAVTLISEEFKRSINDDNGMKLANFNLHSFPTEAIEMIKDRTTRLSLQDNVLSFLPLYFNRLSQLTCLDLHGNSFQEFPLVLCLLQKLEVLDISSNQIRTLPKNVSNLTSLKVLSLQDNALETLPSSVSKMVNLKVLELSGNPMKFPTLENIQIWQQQTNRDWLDSLRSFLSGHGEEKEDSNDSDDGLLIRSRSNSENHISTRAAKRMGFVIKKPVNSESAPLQTAKPIEQDTQNNNTTTTTTITNTTASTSALPSVPPPPPPLSINTTSSVSNAQSITTPTIPTAINPTIAARLSPKDFSGSKKSNVTPRNRSHTFGTSEGNGTIFNHEKKSSAYFKRLSTLPEGKGSSLTQSKLFEISNKIVFSLTEAHNVVQRFCDYCEDAKLSSRMEWYLNNSDEHFGGLVGYLELLQQVPSPTPTSLTDNVISSVSHCLSSFKQIVVFLRSRLDSFTDKANVLVLRQACLRLFGSCAELVNCYQILNPSFKAIPPKQPARTKPLRIDTTATAGEDLPQTDVKDLKEQDELLFEYIGNATSAAQVVFSQLNAAISKSAIASAQGEESGSVSNVVALKVKDLTSTCVSAMDVTRRLHSRLATIRQEESLVEVRKFWDDTNYFLKVIINILASTKSAMADLPMLNDVRSSMATLTKATKDVTIRLEESSFRHLIRANELPALSTTTQFNSNPPLLSSIPSTTVFSGVHDGTLSVSTPLTATLVPGKATHPTKSSGNLFEETLRMDSEKKS
ncbi:hypothetical protein LJB42_001702 [Komagataella kurtzmanii]|nr:hypothetical protein LJB42_001702 [Komagataella kurtzmanii]